MASASDTSVTSGRDRTAGKGIVLAGDRTASRHVARRHSKGVRILKFALPITAIAAVSVYGLSIMQTAGWGTSMPELAMPQILPENLAMENPHYEGFNADGGRYWVRAARAKQDLKAMNVITLEGITGELTDAQKLKTVIAAARGAFDNKSNKLELFDNIDISGDNELKAQLTR
ncbi:MAG: LPS export ABC transporter periplasmic protein LptC, partial [Hyphomicrobium sp.]